MRQGSIPILGCWTMLFRQFFWVFQEKKINVSCFEHTLTGFWYYIISNFFLFFIHTYIHKYMHIYIPGSPFVFGSYIYKCRKKMAQHWQCHMIIIICFDFSILFYFFLSIHLLDNHVPILSWKIIFYLFHSFHWLLLLLKIQL